MTSHRIDEKLKEGTTLSFEFFPPKTPEAQATLVRTLRELEPLEPSFVSVTYGAGGSTRETTHELVVGMARTTTLVPMAHLTCVGHSRLDLAEILVRYARAGITNLMLLGGDAPAAAGLAPSELHHASELVELARSIHPFAVGVAAHPELHPRSPDRATDRKHLAAKLVHADFAITQFFFRVDDYVGLIDDLRDHGIDKPVVPGIMPVTNLAQVARMAQMSGTSVPREVTEPLERAAHDGPDEVRKVGVALAIELSRGLLAAGAPGLHFYTMNRSTATREIAAELGLSPRQ